MTTIPRTAVTSSQIASVGYSPTTFELDIEFFPNKKQREEKQPGSVYRYQKISPAMHQEMLEAESIGRYFGARIKPQPELYPHTKIS